MTETEFTDYLKYNSFEFDNLNLDSVDHLQQVFNKVMNYPSLILKKNNAVYFIKAVRKDGAYICFCVRNENRELNLYQVQINEIVNYQKGGYVLWEN